jgi:hypothetical protein
LVGIACWASFAVWTSIAGSCPPVGSFRNGMLAALRNLSGHKPMDGFGEVYIKRAFERGTMTRNNT